MSEKALAEVLRSMIRIEKKCDEILKLAKVESPGAVVQPLNYAGQVCPLCQRPVTYLSVEMGEGALPEPIRICGCHPAANKLADTGARR